MKERNQFSNAKIVGMRVATADYLAETAQRGEPGYVVSRSMLCEFARCPHRWRAGYERKDSDATDFGSIIDTMLLTPELSDSVLAIRPDTYPAEEGTKTKGFTTVQKKWSRNSTWCREWLAEHAEGKIVLTAREATAYQKLIERLREDFAPILDGADTQVMLTADYTDPATGIVIPVKCLIDLVPRKAFNRSLFDFKTCRSAALETWSRFVFGFGYHIQAALELDMWNMANPGDPREDFRHFGIENVSPFEPFRRLLSQEFIEIGRTAYRAALRKYAGCLASGHWPGYDEGKDFMDGCALVEPLPWMVNAGLEAYWMEPEPEKDKTASDPNDLIV